MFQPILDHLSPIGLCLKPTYCPGKEGYVNYNGFIITWILHQISLVIPLVYNSYIIVLPIPPLYPIPPLLLDEQTDQ